MLRVHVFILVQLLAIHVDFYFSKKAERWLKCEKTLSHVSGIVYIVNNFTIHIDKYNYIAINTRPDKSL